MFSSSGPGCQALVRSSLPGPWFSPRSGLACRMMAQTGVGRRDTLPQRDQVDRWPAPETGGVPTPRCNRRERWSRLTASMVALALAEHKPYWQFEFPAHRLEGSDRTWREDPISRRRLMARQDEIASRCNKGFPRTPSGVLSRQTTIQQLSGSTTRWFTTQ